MNPYLDANIWIGYVWFYYYGGGKGRERPVVKVVDELNTRGILSPVTQFTVAEVSKHFSDWELFREAMKDGYSFWQWRDVRKKYRINEGIKQKVDEIISFINDAASANFVPNIKLSPESVEIINGLVLENQVEFPDAIHMSMAMELKCDYFVTNDEVIRQLLIDKVGAGKDIPQVVRPQEFLRTCLSK